eukprot:COSAG03_NODE_894_length_5464_cov_8.128984_5_plen_74_part_00
MAAMLILRPWPLPNRYKFQPLHLLPEFRSFIFNLLGFLRVLYCSSESLLPDSTDSRLLPEEAAAQGEPFVRAP